MKRAARRAKSVKPRARLLLGVLGAFVAWLAVGTHVASSLHFALVSHRLCAEHGTLEHAHTAELSSTAERTRTHAALRSAGDEAEHEHCQLLARPHETLAVPNSARLTVAAPPRVATSTIEAASAPDVAREALLLLAPKQSPPV